MWHVYILKCSDGSLYTGITTNLRDRLRRHNIGKASKYTRSRKPLELIYSEEFNTKSQAMRREIEIKRLSAANKKKLIRFGPSKRFPSPHEA